jgi:hypothetical protein
LAVPPCVGRTFTTVLYNDPRTAPLQIEKVADYARAALPLPFAVVELRGEFLSHAVKTWNADPKTIARQLACSRLLDPVNCDPIGDPLPGELAYEERMLLDHSRSPTGVAYEGYLVQEILRSLIPRSERRRTVLHIVLTTRLLITREPGEGRGHARTIILGDPTIISIAGIVEAPALKPETYLALQFFRSPDLQSLLFEGERVRHGAIRYGDERLTEVVKGYVLQAVFYRLTGEPFCGDRTCRLYNAHTQEELIESQIRSGRLCRRHESILRGLY